LSAPIYEIRSVKHSYGGNTVLEIDHLTVQPASIVGLIGPNGSGKSTLLRLLGHIESPAQGVIFFNGRPVAPFSDIARFSITLLPQEPFLLKRNVYRNVAYGLKLRGSSDLRQKVDQALAMVGLSGDDFNHRPWYALSGGETQRVALAARLALQPKVLLLDEPNASVDAASAQLIKDAVLRVRQELGTTLIIASHDWQWLNEICDEVVHLFKGRVIGSGRETVIFGPWQKMDANTWGKILSDRQRLLVPPPPDDHTAAVFEILPYHGGQRAECHGDTFLEGTVTHLSLEAKSGQLFGTILVGGLSFKVAFSSTHDETQSPYPGQSIVIAYRLDQVQWI
jgi:tungstate transport system ATP-binding protein